MFSTVYLFFGTDTEAEAAPERSTTKKRKRISTFADSGRGAKVQVSTLTQTCDPALQFGENPEEVAAAHAQLDHVNDGEMARGQVAVPPQQPPQQLLGQKTYVMGV